MPCTYFHGNFLLTIKISVEVSACRSKVVNAEIGRGVHSPCVIYVASESFVGNRKEMKMAVASDGLPAIGRQSTHHNPTQLQAVHA